MSSPAALPRAIPTDYNGTTFRSRFEADTARRLDRGGFRWDYEPISFLLDDGTHYWPDFLVRAQPDGSACRIWLECRGYESEKGERQIDGFARQLKHGESFAVLRPGHAPQWFTPGEQRADVRAGALFDARLTAYGNGRGEEFDRLCAELSAARDMLVVAPSEAAKDDLLRLMTELAKLRRALVTRGAAA